MKIDLKGTGRRLVVSDIHGCLNTFRELVEDKLHLLKDDNLILLGDYIDRGPNSSGVLDYIINLIENSYKVYPLRGNHEENLLRAFYEYDSHTFAHYVGRINKSADLLNSDGTIKSQYRRFISKLEYYFEFGDFIIVHAGINFATENPFSDRVSMLELRHTAPNNAILNGKRIVHGHQVTPLAEIEAAVKQRAAVIPIDNGCFHNKPHKMYDYNQTGHLCSLNLDTFELTVQKNVENG